jgi:hypothetical protein
LGATSEISSPFAPWSHLEQEAQDVVAPDQKLVQAHDYQECGNQGDKELEHID